VAEAGCIAKFSLVKGDWWSGAVTGQVRVEGKSKHEFTSMSGESKIRVETQSQEWGIQKQMGKGR